MNMQFLNLARVLALAVAGAASGGAQAKVEAPPRPRLVVLCSVDQLASWVLARGLPHCGPDGFQRLLREGTSFPQCAYQHACTETGPGHATISTGAPAAVHGIVKNEWFDRSSGKKVYCVEDPDTAALPEFPEGKGRSAARLCVPTFGEALQAHFGEHSKVVSVSWKDRSAILMAGASADTVVWIESGTGRAVTNKAFAEKAPAWLVALQQEPLLDRWFGWKWDRCAPADAYADLVDDRPFELPHQNGSNQRTLPQVVTGGKPDADQPFYVEAYGSPIANEAVLLLAETALQAEELGLDDVPDLLCVGFSGNDVVGHIFGGDSVEARDTLLRTDRLLAQLLRRLDEQVGRGRYLFCLTADHGVGPMPEVAKAAGLDAGRGPVLTRARAAAEKAIRDGLGFAPKQGSFVLSASEMTIFLDRAQLAASAPAGSDAARLFARACELAAAAVVKVPGIQTAFVADDVLRTGPTGDPLRASIYHALHPERGGDVMVVIKPYWLDGMTPASHGSPHSYDREVPMVAMGPSVRAGGRNWTPVTPGFAVVLASRLLGMPVPPAAIGEVPEGVIGR
jgi:hypothetical protein